MCGTGLADFFVPVVMLPGGGSDGEGGLDGAPGVLDPGVLGRRVDSGDGVEVVELCEGREVDEAEDFAAGKELAEL